MRWCVCGFVLFGLSLSVCVGRCLGPVSVSLGPGLALGGLPSFAFKEILDVTHLLGPPPLCGHLRPDDPQSYSALSFARLARRSA